MKTIVIGLGNPILGDDGIGWKIAEHVKNRIDIGSDVEIECLSLGGISLMEHLIGYERAILIDAMLSNQMIGSITVSKLHEVPDYSSLHMTSVHDMSLRTALELGKKMGVKLPDDVTIVGIATEHVYDFSETFSPPVAGAVSKATEIVINLL